MENFANKKNPTIEPTDSFSKHHSCIELLKMKNRELSNDVRILKRLVYMLNVELELRDSSYPQNQSQKSSNHKAVDSFSTDIRMIEPLLRAFEQTKEEKDELLNNYKQSFEEFSNRCKEIIAENESVRQQIEEAKMKAESAVSEWKKLHEKFSLIEEHNRLLTRQVKLYQNKIRSMETIYQTSLKQFEDQKMELCEKLEITKTELCVLKGRYDALNDFKLQSVWQTEHQEQNLHDAVIAEMKNFSAELKLYHEKEIQVLKNRIKFLEDQSTESDIRLATVTSERDYLRGYISAGDLETSKVNSKIENLEKELLSIKKKEGNARHQIANCMDLIRNLMLTRNLQSQPEISVNEKNAAEKEVEN